MNRDDIIRMARESGLITEQYEEKAGDFGNLSRFAALVAAKAAQDEREQCVAAIKSRKRTRDPYNDMCAHIKEHEAEECIAAISARGQ